MRKHYRAFKAKAFALAFFYALFGILIPHSAAFAEEVIHVNGITLQPVSLKLEIGESKVIIPCINPPNATNKKVVWSTSDAGVATVRNGKVTAVGPGNAVITAVTEDGGYSATCTVEVSPVRVTAFSMNAVMSLKAGMTQPISFVISPADATDQHITWQTSDANIATVNSNGIVTAVAPGSAVITGTTRDGGFSDTCSVTVLPVDVEKITLSHFSASLIVGGKLKLTATVLPENATDKSVLWASDNLAVATVSEGVVTAAAPGEAEITAQAGGCSALCRVIVTAEQIPETPAPTQTLAPAPSDVLPTQTTGSATPSATENVEPTASARQTVGVTQPPAPYGPVINAGTPTVLPAGAMVILYTPAISLVPGQTADIYAYSKGGGLDFVSSYPEVASVEDGTVRAHKRGIAIITVSNAAGAAKRCVVTVT